MKPPKQYAVIYKDNKGKGKHKETNNEQTVMNWGLKFEGEVYIDTRYEAKKRLYWYLWRKKEYEQ
jgi:hypothetical protein